MSNKLFKIQEDENENKYDDENPNNAIKGIDLKLPKHIEEQILETRRLRNAVFQQTGTRNYEQDNQDSQNISMSNQLETP